MSTSGAVGVYGMGAGVGRPRDSYVHVAGRPRRVRQRRRAIVLCVASLAVLLIGQQIRGTTADPTTTDPPTADPPTADPTTADPTTADPTTADPTTADPTTADPTTADPTPAD
ncbi:MAG: hypothetical protein ACYCV4_18690, partial [Dermatophilaceae bacterium]